MCIRDRYDRVYKAEDWAWYFATFIANGIFPKPSDGLQVVAYKMCIRDRVNVGNEFKYDNDDKKPKSRGGGLSLIHI